MKIQKQTSDLLMLEEFPVILSLVIGLIAVGGLAVVIVSLFKLNFDENFLQGLFVFVIAFTMLVFMFKLSQFEFNRETGKMVWSRVGLFSRKEGTVPFSEIENVIIKENTLSEGPPTYLVFIITNKGKNAG